MTDLAEADDRCALDVSETGSAYRAECRETAARIANDMQALLAQCEEVFLAWGRDGLLNCTRESIEYDFSVRRHVRVPLPDRSALEASAHFARLLRDRLNDALSREAREAIDTAHA